MGQKRIKVEFLNQSGEKLAGLLELPKAPRAFALFAHCFTCSKDFVTASFISQSLAKQGIAVLRFDFTGLGSSDGDFANSNFSSNVDDLVSAAEFLRENYQVPELLIGHSLGGAAVLIAAQRLEESKAVVTIAAVSNAAVLKRQFAAHEDKIMQDGCAEVNLVGRNFLIKKQFLEDIEKYADADHIAGLNKALLIFHSPDDKIVPIEEASKIFFHAEHPKSFVSLDKADHLLSNKNDAEYTASIIVAWSKKYIGNQE